MTHEWLTSDPHRIQVWEPDYVFLGQNSDLVAESARYLEATEHPPFEAFDDLYYHVRHGARWMHSVTSVLVHADVDGTSEHKKAVAASCKWELNDHEYDQRWDSRMEIISNVIRTYVAGSWDPVDKDGYTEDDLEVLTSKDPTLYYRLPERVVDHIIKLPTKSDKTVALDFVSGEMRKWESRPTMLLITIFDDLQSKYFDHGSGYAIAYDFLEDTIIIKKYQSESIARRFPLHEPWYEVISEDKDVIQTVGSPAEILQRMVDNVLPSRDDPEYGFAVMVQLLAASWICIHWEALQTVKKDDHGAHLTDELQEQLWMKMAEYQLNLRDIPVPQQAKGYKDGIDNTSAKHTYLRALASWKNLKPQFRTQAWKAVQQHKSEEAKGFVDVWHSIHCVLEARAERPDGDDELEGPGSGV
ncbi:MAG: hypothetical protein M1816_005017 [Peltula sp. TS41687]|nr:MAG: hypothetical protein M1816_005017 [Peltula sp. TS41687]